MLLEMLPRANGAKKRPFRFQTCWPLDATFPSIVSQAWGGGSGLADALDLFSRKAVAWNKNQFGNIFTRKKNLMARINGIQRVVANNLSNFLLNLKKELLKELDLVLNQEEELWALKLRVNWMIHGDRNTTFYHVLTLFRRKRNQILAIKNAMGDWIYEVDEIKNVIISGFEGIFFLHHCTWLLELILQFLNGNPGL